MSAAATSASGAPVGGRYALDRLLGAGAMGEVWAARDLAKGGAGVALKLLKEAPEADALLRFRREFVAISQLDHPCCVRVFDFGEQDGLPYFSMERVDGGPLRTPAERPLGEVVEIGRQLAAALDHVHARAILHRDLKPGNVLVAAGAPLRVKLTDFGIAKLQDEDGDTLTKRGEVFGTPQFLSPEQAMGRPLDARSDLYALGLLLFRLACGQPPYAPSVGGSAMAWLQAHLAEQPLPLRALRPEAPAALEQLVAALLEKEPARRVPTAAAALEALEALALDGPRAPLPPTTGGSYLTPAPLLGRAEPLAELRAALGVGGTAPVSQVRLAVVRGDAGIGKSALLSDFSARAHAGGWRVQRAAFSERRPAGAVLDDLFAAAGCAEPAPTGPRRVTDARAERAARLLERLLQRAAEQPLLLVLEDLQWCDPPALELIAFLARGSAGRREPLALCASARAELPPGIEAPLEALVAAGTAHIAALSPLPAGAHRALVAALLTTSDDEELGRFAAAVERVSHGNPLFSRELCAALIEAGTLRRRGARWDLAAALAAPWPTPRSLLELVEQRLGALAPAERGPLELAAVIGPEVELRLLAALVDGAGPALAAIDRGVRGGLLREQARGGAFRFAHDRFREGLYAGLDPAARRAAHGRVAAALEAQGELGARVATHLAAAGDPGPALRRHAAEAAERADARGAPAEAARWLEVALGTSDPGPAGPPALATAALRERFAELCVAAGRFDDAAAIYHAQHAAAADEAARIDAARRLALIEEHRGELAAAQRSYLALLTGAGIVARRGPLGQALGAARALLVALRRPRRSATVEARDQALARVALELVRSSFYQGGALFADALGMMARLCAPLPSSPERAQAAAYGGWAALALLPHGLAVAALARIDRLCDAIGDGAARIVTLVAHAIALLSTGDALGARAYAERAWETPGRVRASERFAVALLAASASTQALDRRGSIRWNERLMAYARAVGDPRMVAWSALSSCFIRAYDAPGETLDLLTEAAAVFGRTADRLGAAFAYFAASDMALLLGRPEEAVRLAHLGVRSGEGVYTLSGYSPSASLAKSYVALALAAPPAERAAALRQARRALAPWRIERMGPLTREQRRLARGAVALAAGRLPQARRAFEGARSRALALGARLEAQAFDRLAAALLAGVDPEAAAHHRARADAVCAAIAPAPPPPEAP